MKRTAFGFIFSVLILSLVGCHPHNSHAAPKEEAKKSEPAGEQWDFGAIKEGEVKKHDFTLKNDLEKTLNITEVSTSCGCTLSKVEKTRLLPGESTNIEVLFDSKGYSGKTKQFIYVSTDNPDNPIIRFIIVAEVIKPSVKK